MSRAGEVLEPRARHDPSAHGGSAATATGAPASGRGVVRDGSFTRDAVSTYATNVVNLCLSTIGGIVTARILGPHDRGIYSLVYLFAATVVTFGKLGLAQANVYSIRRERVPPERVASNALIVALILGSFLACAAIVSRRWLLTTFLRGVPDWAFLISLPLIPVLLFESYFYAVVQALGRFGLYNRRMLVGTASLVCGLCIVLLLLRGGLTGAILVVTFNPVIMDTWLLVTVWRMLRFRLRLDRVLLGREIRFGLKSHLQVMAQHLHLRADVYLVAYFLDPAQVAFYVLAAKFAELMLDIPKAIGIVLYPRLAALDDAAMHRLTARACRRTILVTGAAGVAISVLGPTLIVLWYGAAYAPAAKPLPLITAGIVMMSVLVLLTQSFTSRNKQQVNIVVGLVALVGNLGLNVVLIPSLGIVGAALASAISYGVAAGLLLALFLVESRLSVREVLAPNADDVSFFWNLVVRAVQRGKGAALSRAT
jgi:O-antigen/teichoic acid export membrane protein